MCFYNLIPCGQICNGLKLQNELGMNPYEDGIEKQTFLYPNLPVGVNIVAIKEEDCKILFHAQAGMIKNEKLLALEQRYSRYSNEAYRLLRNKQLEEGKIDELMKVLGKSRKEILEMLFGPQDKEIKKKQLRQKMLKDLTGY